MHGHAFQDWRSMVALTCSFAVILVIVAWNMRKSSSSSEENKEDKVVVKESEEPEIADTREEEKICQNNVTQEVEEKLPCNDVTADTTPELSGANWAHVGQVEELYFYPLKSGRGKDVSSCNFTEHGISLENSGRFTLRDRMFLVYSEETGHFQTGRNYPTLILVSLTAVDEFKVKLEAVGMPSVVFDVPKDSKSRFEAVECKMWWGEPVKCIDCGEKPAEWLSRFLTGTNEGLRLGYTTMDKRNIVKGSWEKFAKVYSTLRDEDSGLFCDLTSYMLMTTASLDELNKKLERPVPALQFRPNIVVSGHILPFAEDTWEWLRIGKNAVIRNVKPCPRFREQTNPERISVDGKTPVMGIYCGLYVPGKVQVGDEVYVHM